MQTGFSILIRSSAASEPTPAGGSTSSFWGFFFNLKGFCVTSLSCPPRGCRVNSTYEAFNRHFVVFTVKLGPNGAVAAETILLRAPLFFCSSLQQVGGRGQLLFYIHRLRCCTRFGTHITVLNVRKEGSLKRLRRRFVLLLLARPRHYRASSGSVVVTSPHLRADPLHAHALFGEVPGQSRVVNLLHVLLHLGFGLLQQVGLTLGERQEVR